MHITSKFHRLMHKHIFGYATHQLNAAKDPKATFAIIISVVRPVPNISHLPVLLFSSPEQKAPGELIGWQPPSSVGISLQPASRSQPNFICSLSLVGDCFHMHFRNITLELWLLWQLIGPIGLLWEMLMNSVPSLFYLFYLHELANNNDMHKI